MGFGVYVVLIFVMSHSKKSLETFTRERYVHTKCYVKGIGFLLLSAEKVKEELTGFYTSFIRSELFFSKLLIIVTKIKII